MNDSWRFPSLVALLALIATQPGPSPGMTGASQESAASGQTSGQIERAQEHLERREYAEAIKILRRAKRGLDGVDADLELNLALAYNGMGAFKDAAESAKAAIAGADGDIQRAAAYNALGIARFAGGGADEDGFRESAEAFEMVLELTAGEANTARASLAEALLQLGEDAAAIAHLEAYLELEPNGARADRARSLIDNPLRARVPLLPDFDAVTLSGEFLTADDLSGQVVLIDFWGTWCEPCVRAIPGLRGMSKRRAKSPFEIVSVSSDRDEAKLREFVAEKEMDWIQIWDQRGELARAFDVQSYPTYLVVDPDGEIVHRVSGWSPQLEQQVNAQISKAIRQHVKKSR